MAALLLVLLVSGCAFLQDYSRQTEPARLMIARNDFGGALAEFPEKAARGRNEVLVRLERGKLLQDMGLFSQSTADFNKCDQKIAEFEGRAVVSASKAAAEAGSLLVNEQVMPYEGEDFEKILMHAFDALNYLMLGNLMDARVEVRKSYALQETLSAKHASELKKAEEQSWSQGWQSAFAQADAYQYDATRAKAAAAYSVYHNAFASYVSALVYELDGEPDEAYIDLKKAILAAPNSASIQADLIRLARALNYKDDLADWERRFGPRPAVPKQAVDVFLIFSHGLAPYKQALNLPIPTNRGLVFASLPVYGFSPASVYAAEIEASGLRATSSTVFDTDAVAARTLLDAFPIIFAKQSARAYLKAKALSSLDEHQGDLGAFIGMVYSLVTERADLRAWSTLPKQIQVARVFLPRSTAGLTVRALPTGEKTYVPIPAGASHLVILCRAGETGLSVHTRSF